MPNEADTCRRYVVPLLQAAGWEVDPHRINEQVTFTDGRIILAGKRVKRGNQKRADYILRYARDLPLAVVEAKADYKLPGDGLQQAKDYAEILDLKFAYSTNGQGIVEFDYMTGHECTLTAYPTPQELWARLYNPSGLSAGGPGAAADAPQPPGPQAAALLPGDRHRPRGGGGARRPAAHPPDDGDGHGQDAAWRSRSAGSSGPAAGTATANTGGRASSTWPTAISWSTTPRIRPSLPFGDARCKIESGQVVKSREMYFAIYQAIAGDENRAGLYKEYPPDFFDLIIVDECHRGSARDDRQLARDPRLLYAGVSSWA